jgi:hypothetical protein
VRRFDDPTILVYSIEAKDPARLYVMKPGDTVVALRSCSIESIKDPTFFRRSLTRCWEPGQAATITSICTRQISGREVIKLEILLDGGRWWVGAALVQLQEIGHEDR